MLRTNIVHSGTQKKAIMSPACKIPTYLMVNKMVRTTVRLLAETTFTMTLKVLHNISMSVTSIFLVLCFRTSAQNIRTFKKSNFFSTAQQP